MKARATTGASDQAIMEAVRDGSERALGMLLRSYWPCLLNYAASIVGSRDDAEDVMQQVFAQVWVARARWDSRGSVSAYLYRCTRNVALNWQRDRKLHLRVERWGGLRLVRQGAHPDPHEELEARSLRDAVESAIGALPDRRREAFILSRYHRLSYAEIAETMGISVPTVANQISAALRQLAHVLSEHLHLARDLGPDEHP